MDVPFNGHHHGDMPMTPLSSSVPKGDLRNTDMNMNMDMDMDMDMIHMSLYWGKAAVVLFSGWPGQHVGMYTLALFFVFLMAIAAEIFSVSPTVKAGTRPATAGIIQTSVYVFHIGLTYLVMLAVMSFNIGIFMAAVVGHSLGFFLVKVRAHALANKTTDPKA